MPHDKIMAMVREKGPVLPIEVASYIGKDSFMAKVMLRELVDEGRLKASEEQVGSSYVYFLPGQENAASAKINELLKSSEKRVKHFSDKPISDDPDILKKREEFAKRFEHAMKDEPKEPKRQAARPPEPLSVPSESRPFIISAPEPKPILTQKFMEFPKPVPRPPELTKRASAPIVKVVERAAPPRLAPMPKNISVSRIITSAPAKKSVDFVELASTYLRGSHAEILETTTVKKGKEANLIANIPSSIGTVRFFVKIKSKKKVNEADLSMAYTEGMQHRLPVFFLTDGNMTGVAKELADRLEGYLKVKSLQS